MDFYRWLSLRVWKEFRVVQFYAFSSFQFPPFLAFHFSWDVETLISPEIFQQWYLRKRIFLFPTSSWGFSWKTHEFLIVNRMKYNCKTKKLFSSTQLCGCFSTIGFFISVHLRMFSSGCCQHLNLTTGREIVNYKPLFCGGFLNVRHNFSAFFRGWRKRTKSRRKSRSFGQTQTEQAEQRFGLIKAINHVIN